jgi:pimeloyl-[acyl-carrier protein] methyl ester esterase
MTALVLLPGMDGTGALRSEFVTALAPAIQSIVVSYPAERALGYIELEAVVRSKLPSDRSYVLLGESFSGPIAIAIAAKRPPGLIGLVLCCSFARNPRPVLGSLRRLLPLFPFKRIPTGLLSPFVLGSFATATLQAALITAVSELPSATLRTRAAAVLAVDVSSLLPDIRVPVLYLRSSQDRIVPRSCSEAIVRGAPQTRIVEINGPHFLLQAAPAEAAKAVRDFLETLAPISTPKL